MATHDSIKSFCTANPAHTPAGIRNRIFKHGRELERAGALVRSGRKIILIRERLLAAIESGLTSPDATKSRKATV